MLSACSVLLMQVAPKLRSQQINEQLVFAKMNLPDRMVPLVLRICLNFKASANVMLPGHPSFTNQWFRQQQRWAER